MTEKPKLFFHVQHLLGIGHQMRAAALTRACLKAGFEAHYISGGFPEELPDLGDAYFHQLTPTKTRNGDFNQLIDEKGDLIDEKWWQERRNQLIDLYNKISPDVILLEGFPFARRKFKEELIPLLEKAKNDNIPCATSIRDILVDPKKEKKRQFAFDTTNQYLDRVLIHGEKEFCPLERSFKDADCLGDKLIYTGYVDSGSSKALETGDLSEVVISAGGGAVGQRIYETALQAYKLSQNKAGIWRLLLGPNLPDSIKTKLKSQAQDNLIIEDARSDFRNLLSSAKLSISQAGYNTIMDILATGVNSLVIPFADGEESEQTLRAELLAQANRLSIVDESSLTPDLLADKIDILLANQAVIPHTPFPLDGAEKSATILKSLLRN
ncbi:glycosyltransferase family protein [Curvivirga sp.]|uniref:glycosyltransferase family protein n=1 Tax=Curvivirga sp. TaxID=2856848 RepID=UPI003B5A8935